ncbi:uncharacterized protein E5676_scaffold162G00350 [Cucumis melo var. makuwa]|uniref:Ubiquitin-like protease family profile domain-containing protein n=1 Tax=Cucumis melo var. makuwa TaxID=1194695 RepID=A0A5D3DJI5_CUCMM|nr:uncharacterized protein E5676_scaffold162G00350 [Cucumis melo var. makuwa]
MVFNVARKPPPSLPSACRVCRCSLAAVVSSIYALSSLSLATRCVSFVCVLCLSSLESRCRFFRLCMFVVARKQPSSLSSARFGRLCVVFVFCLPILFVVFPLRSSVVFHKPLLPFLPFSVQSAAINRKSCVLREDIIDFCNMREVKTLTLVAYMAYLHSQDELSNYIFVDPSFISFGHNIQEVRARNLCNRLMASKRDQLVLAPFNPSGHLALLAIKAYDETVYYLDTLQTTSRVDIRYVTNTAITIFRSQKNIQTSRKQPI